MKDLSIFRTDYVAISQATVGCKQAHDGAEEGSVRAGVDRESE